MASEEPLLGTQTCGTVCIIGGGASGLIALKRMRDEGIDAVVFEGAASLGGIWARGSTKMYSYLRANTPRTWMHLRDFAFPQSDNDHYPHHSVMTEQLLAFADRWDLASSCRLSSRVSSVRRTGSGEFEVCVNGAWLGPFARCCVATGKAGAVNVPPIPVSAETTAFHSSDLGQHEEALAGARVVVVGFGPSGVDACELAVQRGAASVTLLSESPIFLLPRMKGGAPAAASLKLFQLLAPGSVMQKALRKQVFKFPTTHPAEYTFGVHSPVPVWDLHELIASGAVQFRLTSLLECRDGCAVLANGVQEPADVCIWCTGYRSTALDVLDAPLRAQVLADSPLFESVWAPGLPGLALLGQGWAFWWYLELQAQWVAKVWAGRAVLPPPAEMRAFMGAVRAQQAAVQAGACLPRPRPHLFAESPLASGVRVSKRAGGWPGLARLLCGGCATFEPRRLFTRPFGGRERPRRTQEEEG